MVKPAAKKKAAAAAAATSKGKQRIQIAYIEDKEKRQVTFSKRKGGILKKASELHLLCGAHVAIVIFSQTHDASSSTTTTTSRRRGGNVFAMGSPSVDHVMSRLAGTVADGADPYGGGHHRAAIEEEDGVGGREGAEAAARRRDEARELVDAEGERMKVVTDKVWLATAVGRFWWEADVEALGEAELPEFGGALKRLRDNVMRRHADKLVVPQ